MNNTAKTRRGSHAGILFNYFMFRQVFSRQHKAWVEPTEYDDLLKDWIPSHLSSVVQSSLRVLLKLYIIHIEFGSKALADAMDLTLISTWLKVLPLYTPTMDPTISGRMTMSLRWVFTTSGFSMGGASFLALRRRLRRDCCLRRRPRFSLLLWRAQYSCISCSLYIRHGDVKNSVMGVFHKTISRCNLTWVDDASLYCTETTIWYNW